MAYPEICTRQCRNWGTEDCPNSAQCLATAEKPYFQLRKQEGKGGWMARLLARKKGGKAGEADG